MKIEFDKAKNKRNIELRGLSFEMCGELEWHNAILWRDIRKEYAENRECALAPLEGRIYFVTFTVRGRNVRIISFRKANKREVINYEKKKKES